MNDGLVAQALQLIDLHLGEHRIRDTDPEFSEHVTEVADFLEVYAGVIVAKVGVEDVSSSLFPSSSNITVQKT